jgi:hypothetical protein
VATTRGLSRDLDVRLLAELDRKTWDSLATVVRQAITDSVIREGVYALPAAYHPRLAEIEHKLRARRDRLNSAAAAYYRSLALITSVHASDADDEARIRREADGSVLVEVGSEANPWFSRRFVPGETREIRLFLHGGDDRATITGVTGPGITLRVVGGGGDNRLVNEASGSDRQNRLYDIGPTEPERHEPDTAFNRLPLVRESGTWVIPNRDWGTRTAPIASIGTGRGLGIVPKLGIRHETYGFRRSPYNRMVSLQGEYATDTRGLRFLARLDHRVEQSRVHIGADAEMSEFEVVQFNGFGNDVPYSRDPFFDVDQRLWALRPVIGYSYGRNKDLTIGPVVEYVTTDSVPNRFISEERPYGFGRFGQVGLEAKLEHDTREDPAYPRQGVFLRASGAAYPGVWDARRPFQKVAASASTYLPIPVRERTVLALRAGGEKVFGDFPYYEAAFLGGSRTLRTARYHRFAGDASVFGTAELRVPLFNGPFILPWDIGALGYLEAGRVYMNGESPGGWHRAAGAGVWIGVLSPATSLSVLFTNGRERRILIGTGTSF